MHEPLRYPTLFLASGSLMVKAATERENLCTYELSTPKIVECSYFKMYYPLQNPAENIYIWRFWFAKQNRETKEKQTLLLSEKLS